jgi:hypothetical protein
MPVISDVVGICLCLALLVLWLGAKHEDRLALERDCRHRWVLESLYDEGQLWYRRCERCGKQQPVKHPELVRSHRQRPPERRRPRR